MANIPITTGMCVDGVRCGSYDCNQHNNCESVETYFDKGFNHSIHNQYLVTCGGVTINMIKTDRELSAFWKIDRDDPIKVNGMFQEGYGTIPLICESHEPDRYYCSFSDVGTVIGSKIFYIDHRYGICLYNRETFTLDCSAESTEIAKLKQTMGELRVSQLQIKTSDYTASRLSEWVLIKDGVETVLTSETFDQEPFGGKNSGQSWRDMGWVSNEVSGIQYFPDYTPDPETRMVLLFPQPGSLGISVSEVICRLGFYDYGNEPGEEPALGKSDGGKDMFYPSWYREYCVIKDTMWEEARTRRWNAKWNHIAEEPSRTWKPPTISVEPLPCGTYAKHPQVGEAYQWLLSIDGSSNEPFISTSPDMNTLIDDRLSTGNNTHDTTLYYPIGII